MSPAFFTFCIFAAVGFIYGDDDSKTESELRRHLFEHYDKLVRPVRMVSNVVHLDVGLSPFGIKDVDVQEKSVKLDTCIFMEWEDDYLRWDPAEYGGLTILRLPHSEVWKPDFSIYYTDTDTSMQPIQNTNVFIYHNGTILWVPPFNLKSRCTIVENQLTDDTFLCTVIAGSWSYDVNLLDIKHRDFQKDALEFFHDGHKEWRIESMTSRSESRQYACCPEYYSTVYFDFVFKKKAGEAASMDDAASEIS